MAFYQPTHAPARQVIPQDTVYTPKPVPSVQQRPNQESQEWILFPAQTRSSVQTQTTSTEVTSRTAGLSRLSDLGSLASLARSEDNEGAVDDDELDSLDDGLHAFQAHASVYGESRYLDQSDAILPTHDGLGTFATATIPVQQQLWHFEQYNPRKRTLDGHHRRRSSVQRRLDAVADREEAAIQRERVDRIQKWRLEQSRILLDEVEKHTKRRLSTTSQRSHAPAKSVAKDTTRNVQDSEGDEAPSTLNPEEFGNESFWQRVTRRVIRDFIGIDEPLLSVILGESLPCEPTKPSAGLSASKSTLDLSLAAASGSGWEDRLLDRLSRELGVLVQHISEHPGTLSSPTIPLSLDYAGIPVSSPSTTQDRPRTTTTQKATITSPTNPVFKPTLQQSPTSSHSESTHAALWGIEEEPSPPETQSQLDRDYWEGPPTLKTIFRFLHQRFTASRPLPPRPTNIASTTTPDSLRRAAIIRAHHPLVSRAHVRRSVSKRPESSCGSISVKRRRSESSRNYWDLGGSTASGSAIAAGGYGMGGWGEV